MKGQKPIKIRKRIREIKPKMSNNCHKYDRMTHNQSIYIYIYIYMQQGLAAETRTSPKEINSYLITFTMESVNIQELYHPSRNMVHIQVKKL